MHTICSIFSIHVIVKNVFQKRVFGENLFSSVRSGEENSGVGMKSQSTETRIGTSARALMCLHWVSVRHNLPTVAGSHTFSR